MSLTEAIKVENRERLRIYSMGYGKRFKKYKVSEKLKINDKILIRNKVKKNLSKKE